MTQGKLQATGRAWTQPHLTAAHRLLMEVDALLVQGGRNDLALLDLPVQELRALLEKADALLYQADQAIAYHDGATELAGGG